ncbi:MAG TPA: hypothetical protein VJ302_37980 [Blastocatellia bacterium]|nr:hypothetical protein [Blastocatellia bacterium]
MKLMKPEDKLQIYYHPDQGAPEIDLLILEAVFDYQIHRIRPSWYLYEVVLAINKQTGLIDYSYDENNCNARVYRNGIDESEGIAESIPRYSLDDRNRPAEFLHIVDRMREQNGYYLELGTGPSSSLQGPVYFASFWQSPEQVMENEVSAKTIPLAVTIAALRVLRFPNAYWQNVFKEKVA